ncbi:MAG: hypothetical protein MUC33_01270 [Desulfobacterales bacterium]|nr:hypothetical protein [Desulfobacterales bacterium]
MAIHKDHLRQLIRETLRHLEPEIPYSEAAVELLMLTAAQETQLGKYLVQIKGPARGIYQVEPASERSVLAMLALRHPALHAKLMALNLAVDGQDGQLTDRDIIHNLAYATALARCFYWLKPGPIPKAPGDQAAYYKKYWNTHLGKATEAEALAAYCSLCLPVKEA